MKARPSMEKRRKELARKDRQEAKAERRERRKAERAARVAEGEETTGPPIAPNPAQPGLGGFEAVESEAQPPTTEEK